MKVFALVILFTATAYAQNPYEYVDDALLQRVGQIIFEYDQRTAATRSTGGSSSNNYQQNVVDVSSRNAGYQSYQQPQQRSVSNNVGYSANYRSQQNYNTYQPQQNYQNQVNRVQRQYNYNPAPVSQPQPTQRVAYQTSRAQRQLAMPYTYQAPQVQQRTYEQPQVQQKSSGLSGYILSEPIPVARVAEFHFTDSQGQGQQGSGDAGASPVRNNNRFSENRNLNSNLNNGFRLA